MRVREIDDLITDLHGEFIRMLPGGRGTSAAWSAFCTAWREYEFAKLVVEEEADSMSPRKWLYMGEMSACGRIIRAIADQMKVKSVVDTEANVG